MARMSVKSIPSGHSTPDGKTIYIDAVLTNGVEHTLAFPYRELDALVQALLQLSAQAYERQVNSGTLPEIPGAVGDTIPALNGRVLVEKSSGTVVVQLIVREAANAPLEKASLRLDANLARTLGQQLIEASEQLRQAEHPH